MSKQNKIIIVLVSVIAVLLTVFAVLILVNKPFSSEDENLNDSNTTQEQDQAQEQKQEQAQPKEDLQEKINAAYAKLNITKDIRPSLAHGVKTKEYQKYIVLHDTEGDGPASGVVNYWESNGKYVAAQYIVNKDGSIVQCVDIDQIAHHSGFGDTGHNSKYGTPEDGRDDMRGAERIGSWASDYGMNAWSIGIEMVHVGGSGAYPEAQLQAVDNLIAYFDAYYGGNAGQIIDHKAWRTGNSDTSPEFANYLANYQSIRRHA